MENWARLAVPFSLILVSNAKVQPVPVIHWSNLLWLLAVIYKRENRLAKPQRLISFASKANWDGINAQVEQNFFREG
jgi:hypothetical protein